MNGPSSGLRPPSPRTAGRREMQGRGSTISRHSSARSVRMHIWKKVGLCVLAVLLAGVSPGSAFLEDLCLPRRLADGTLSWCVRPDCPVEELFPNRACAVQLADFATIQPGRSMIHHD